MMSYVTNFMKSLSVIYLQLSYYLQQAEKNGFEHQKYDRLWNTLTN